MTDTTNPTVLVVDDSKMSRMLITANLTNLRPNWNIIQAANGNEAISMAAANNPHYITMDLNMPGMDGMKASAEIKSTQPQIKIAMCTANFQDSVQENASNGGLFFIAKPITEKSMQAAIDFFEG